MIRPALLVALAALSSGPSRAQTRIEAPGGVAAQRIENSPITIGIPPAEHGRVVDILVRQIAAGADVRAQAEARATELAVQLGVTREAVIAFLRTVGEQDVPPDLLFQKLGEVAMRHRALLARGSVLDPADPLTAALTGEWRAAIAGGRYDEADALLRRARDRETAAAAEAERLASEARAAADRRWLAVAEADGERGDIAMTRLRYREAATLYAAAAARTPEAHPDVRDRYLDREILALFSQGQERADRAAAADAVRRAREAVASVDRAAAPDRWVLTRINLGNALAAMAKREREAGNLEEAAAILRAAADATTPGMAPSLRAAARMSLGNVLADLAERGPGTERLEQSIALLRSASEDITRESDSLAWGVIQMNLGVALAEIGMREARPDRLEQAVVAFRLALEGRTRARDPLGWATTQANLGVTLGILGGREAATRRLDEAVEAHHAALEIRTRARDPLGWARLQMNLGTALADLGRMGRDRAALDEAVRIFRLVLEEQRPDRNPRGWALTRLNLGTALADLGREETGTETLDEAIRCVEDAARGFDAVGDANLLSEALDLLVSFEALRAERRRVPSPAP